MLTHRNRSGVAHRHRIRGRRLPTERWRSGGVFGETKAWRRGHGTAGLGGRTSTLYGHEDRFREGGVRANPDHLPGDEFFLGVHVEVTANVAGSASPRVSEAQTKMGPREGPPSPGATGIAGLHVEDSCLRPSSPECGFRLATAGTHTGQYFALDLMGTLRVSCTYFCAAAENSNDVSHRPQGVSYDPQRVRDVSSSNSSMTSV